MIDRMVSFFGILNTLRAGTNNIVYPILRNTQNSSHLFCMYMNRCLWENLNYTFRILRNEEFHDIQDTVYCYDSETKEATVAWECTYNGGDKFRGETPWKTAPNTPKIRDGEGVALRWMSGKYKVGMVGGWNWLRIMSTNGTVLSSGSEPERHISS
jgi:hypothetical protein